MNHRKLNTNDFETCENDIYHSWEKSKQLERMIISSSNQNKWTDVLSNCQTRTMQLLLHFKKYPIGPETAYFYQHNLSEHLRNEKIIEQIRRKATKQILQLVK
ncbi:hypothetical protein NO559_01315 [Dasania sp. GY-MA-18]|uniref:Uncharacterized protein n=1 Tax=Dasania phycosphaerae TaxID=2950436 RepID=A0A9J6RHH8_9GAMM|nr:MULTISPECIES: hypothetical protein [Dasania]MCR8921390.1 hypothetical protein [Dasania sp. GY-MA-18]MCZ0863818.1 hypothetical protein [Dasania phycosphaerae]MCZ0867546.1 hypothetical protein [Dasania phycosphaerae]